MPKNAFGKVVCVNHPDQQMTEDDGQFVMLELLRQEGNELKLDMESGLGMKIHYCPMCNYVEMYAS